MANFVLFDHTKMVAYDSGHVLLKINVHVVGIDFKITYRVIDKHFSPRIEYPLKPWFTRVDSRDTDILLYVGVAIAAPQRTKYHFLELFFDDALTFRIPVLCIMTAGPTAKEISRANSMTGECTKNDEKDKCHRGSLNTGSVVNENEMLQALTVNFSNSTKKKTTEKRVCTAGYQTQPAFYLVWNNNIHRVCFPSKQTFQTLDVNLCTIQDCDASCPLFSNAMIKHLMVMIECGAWEFYQAALSNDKFLKGLETSDIQHYYADKAADPADLIEGMLQNGGPPLFAACMATPQCQRLTCDDDVYKRYLYQLVANVRRTGTLKCWFSGHIKTCHYSMFYRATVGHVNDQSKDEENLLRLYNLTSCEPRANIGGVEIPTRDVSRVLETVGSDVVKLAQYFGYI